MFDWILCGTLARGNACFATINLSLKVMLSDEVFTLVLE